MNLKRAARRLRRRRPIKVVPGQAPGTITVDKSAPKPIIDVFEYDADQVTHHQHVTADQIPRPQTGKTLWVNVVGLGDQQIIREIGRQFDIHSLSLEDVVNTHQRPKFEVFPDHLYIITRIPTANGDVVLEQISLFVGRGYVLTWQEHKGDCFGPIRERLHKKSRSIRHFGGDYLAYALVDAVVDSYFPLINQYNVRLDEIEDDLERPDMLAHSSHAIHDIRSDVRHLRRAAWSHRDVLRSWMAYDGEFTTEETQLHLRDVADHTIRVVELLEQCRENCSDLRDLHMAAASMRMNEVMKVLTVISTLFISMSFIAGLYGMNFSPEVSPWNMPETQWYFGYPFALALMVAVAIGMVAFFVRKGWIGSGQ